MNMLGVQRLDRIRGLYGERTLTDLREVQFHTELQHNVARFLREVGPGLSIATP
jgi:hypothetical protein